MRSAQLVGSAPLVVQPARVGTPFFLTQAQAFVIPVRAVMGLLMGFTVRPRHVARTNVAFHSCKCPQKRVQGRQVLFLMGGRGLDKWQKIAWPVTPFR